MMSTAARALFLIFIVIECVNSKSAYFEPCQVSSPTFNSCLMSTAQNMVDVFVHGNPELKLKGLNPYTIDDIENKASTLKFNFNNNVIYGPIYTKITNITLDPKKKKIFLEYKNHGYMLSDYKLEGRLIILPVTGAGRSNISLGDTIYTYDIDYDITKGKDGRDHWKIKKHQVSYSPEYVTFSFENLFNGNKELSDNIHTFANENWKEIFTELGPSLMSKIINRVIKEIGKFFAAIPAEDMIRP